jgi:hypothetical protein
LKGRLLDGGSSHVKGKMPETQQKSSMRGGVFPSEQDGQFRPCGFPLPAADYVVAGRATFCEIAL